MSALKHNLEPGAVPVSICDEVLDGVKNFLQQASLGQACFKHGSRKERKNEGFGAVFFQNANSKILLAQRIIQYNLVKYINLIIQL